jgi:Sulfotransferase domain
MTELRPMMHDIVPLRFRRALHRKREAIRATSFWARHITPLGNHQVLPTFLVIGAQRCGTSTFFELLSQHPRLIPPKRGEIHYFDLHYRYGIKWYRACFRNNHLLRTKRQLTFDCSPYYIFHPAVPARVAADLPHAKIIALLRDPARRAFSHYMHERTRGRETYSFEQALEAEEKRLQGEEQRLMEEVDYCSFAHRRFSYCARGHYAAQLDRWLQYFGRDRILIIKSEALFADPRTQLERVWGFLNIEPVPLIERRHRNQTIYQETLTSDTLARLTTHFSQVNRRLPQIAGDSFVW